MYPGFAKTLVVIRGHFYVTSDLKQMLLDDDCFDFFYSAYTRYWRWNFDKKIQRYNIAELVCFHHRCCIFTYGKYHSLDGSFSVWESVKSKACKQIIPPLLMRRDQQ